jgi:hypothetical protein
VGQQTGWPGYAAFRGSRHPEQVGEGPIGNFGAGQALVEIAHALGVGRDGRQPGSGEGSGVEIHLSRHYGFIPDHQVIDLRGLHDHPRKPLKGVHVFAAGHPVMDTST